MTSTTVFRVAHRELLNPVSGTHFGPYATYQMPFDEPQIDKDTTDEHPTPMMEGLRYLEDDEVCGFYSLEACLSWFSEYEREELECCNFHIQVWEVPSQYVRVGAKQTVFVPKQGRIVDTLDTWGVKA